METLWCPVLKNIKGLKTHKCPVKHSFTNTTLMEQKMYFFYMKNEWNDSLIMVTLQFSELPK